MKKLIQPEGVTEKELETYVAGLQENAEKDVPFLRGSGAGEAEIFEYIASLGPEPEDTIGLPDGQPVRTERISGHVPSRQHQLSNQNGRAASTGAGTTPLTTPPERIPSRRRGKLAEESHRAPPGVQGANTGYWQAGGVTRAGAKRSKRP
jgi:hypothetical protein